MAGSGISIGNFKDLQAVPLSATSEKGVRQDQKIHMAVLISIIKNTSENIFDTSKETYIYLFIGKFKGSFAPTLNAEFINFA